MRISLRMPTMGSLNGERLRLQARANHVGQIGRGWRAYPYLIGGYKVTTNQLPALNDTPVDVTGAGDSMLIAASMALTVGGSPWEASLIGNVASATLIGWQSTDFAFRFVGCNRL